jgi:hypothetical protein
VASKHKHEIILPGAMISCKRSGIGKNYFYKQGTSIKMIESERRMRWMLLKGRLKAFIGLNRQRKKASMPVVRGCL